MFSTFFIDRPIFATVLSLLVTLAGSVSLFTLPVTQYPEITPPTVEVSTVYPGANAQVVADTVAAPIEQQVNGVEGMLYMSSQSTNDGAYTLTITFKHGSDLNLAQVLVQNRVSLAQPILPDLVKRRGVTVKKKSPSVLLIVNLYSPDHSRDNLYLSNYATIQLADELSRLPGVGDITYMGKRDYSMRVWLDPQKMAARGLSSQDIVAAISQQNTQVAAGQIGQPPAPSSQVFQYTMTTQGRVTDEDEFARMIVYTDDDGRVTRVRDVARVELGALAYDQVCTLDGQPSVAMSIFQLPGTNALRTASAVRSKMNELRTRFPDGVDYSIVYDTTPFIQESVSEVFTALRDAMILVALVVLVFLQGWRAAVIPLVAAPVAIVGAFAAMAAFDFSLNTLTLFGLVLAVGIVVDDAIVVVEAIEHHIEQGMEPRDAAIRAMEEVSGPVIAIGLVLSAVFIPCAFLSGVVGQFFRQFALTIAISTIISAFNSLTLSPALAVLLLRPKSDALQQALPKWMIVLLGAWMGVLLIDYTGLTSSIQRSLVKLPASIDSSTVIHGLGGLVGALVAWLSCNVVNALLSRFFRAFGRAFDALANGYTLLVRSLLRVSILVVLVYFGLCYGTYGMYQQTPKGFIPGQDKGYLLLNVRLPDIASLARTQEVLSKLSPVCQQVEGVSHTIAIAGQSILLGANAPNFGSVYVMLDGFEQRKGAHLSATAIAEKLNELLADVVQSAELSIFNAPPLDGLGTAGGFKIVIEDRGDAGLTSLERVSSNIIDDLEVSPTIKDAFSSLRGSSTWLLVDVDRVAAKTMGLSLTEVFGAIQSSFASFYINDFNRFGRTWQVNIQAESQFRMSPKDVSKLYIPNASGRMTPLSSFASLKEVPGPTVVTRYNLYPASFINADAAMGTSSGQAIAEIEGVASRNLNSGMRAEWTELAFLQQDVGSAGALAFSLAVVLVFLVLAAQYESWSLPLAVILVVPMCLLCAVVGISFARMDINIFTQVGFVVLVGLACKNAILIVEFARTRNSAGISAFEATLEACRLRLRPIVMTSLAFIFGVIPLMLGRGAGAEMRQTLGVSVFAGMLGVTFFGVFLTPVFFYCIQTVSASLWPPKQEEQA